MYTSNRLLLGFLQEERAEQLRSFSFLSGIVAGFAIASFLQLDLHVTSDNSDNPDQPFTATPQSWQLGFAISVGLTVRSHSVLVLVPMHALQSSACCMPCIAVEVRLSLQQAKGALRCLCETLAGRIWVKMLHGMALLGAAPEFCH